MRSGVPRMGWMTMDVLRGREARRTRLTLATTLLMAVLALLRLASVAYAGDRVYWANGNSPTKRISWASLDGAGAGDLDTSGATTGQPRGASIDAAHNRVYWSNPDSDRISFASLEGSGGGGDLA